MIPSYTSYTYGATVERVVDGDTLDVVIDLGFRLSQRTRIRVLHVDCSERGTTASAAATAYVRDLLPVGAEVVLKTTKPDKYGRSLAQVHISRIGNDLGTLLVAEGHAVAYEGGTRA